MDLSAISRRAAMNFRNVPALNSAADRVARRILALGMRKGERQAA